MASKYCKECRMRMSSLDPHEICVDCNKLDCSSLKRCQTCLPLSDADYDKLQLQWRKRRREKNLRKSSATPELLLHPDPEETLSSSSQKDTSSQGRQKRQRTSTQRAPSPARRTPTPVPDPPLPFATQTQAPMPFPQEWKSEIQQMFLASLQSMAVLQAPVITQPPLPVESPPVTPMPPPPPERSPRSHSRRTPSPGLHRQRTRRSPSPGPSRKRSRRTPTPERSRQHTRRTPSPQPSRKDAYASRQRSRRTPSPRTSSRDGSYRRTRRSPVLTPSSSPLSTLRSRSPTRRSRDTFRDRRTPSPSHDRRIVVEDAPLEPDEVTWWVVDYSGCPSPSKEDFDPDAALPLEDNRVLLPHHPYVLKAVDASTDAMRKLKKGTFLRNIPHSDSKAPVHESNIPRSIPQDDEDLHRLSGISFNRATAHDSHAVNQEQNLRNMLPLISYATWTFEAVKNSLGSSTATDTERIASIDRASASLLRLAEITSVSIANSTVSRRNTALKDTDFSKETIADLIQTPWMEEELFGGKLNQKFAKLKEEMDFDIAARQVRPTHAKKMQKGSHIRGGDWKPRQAPQRSFRGRKQSTRGRPGQSATAPKSKRK